MEGNDTTQSRIFLFGFLLGILFSHSGMVGFFSGAATATFLLKKNNETVISTFAAMKKGGFDIIESIKILLR